MRSVLATRKRKRRTSAKALVNAFLLTIMGVIILALAIFGRLQGRVGWRELSLGRAWSLFWQNQEGEFKVLGVTNGLYDTQAGRPVFVVRGSVKNESKERKGPIKVTAELRKGSAIARSAEILAGEAPTAEEVFQAINPAAVGTLNQRLARKARAIDAGSSAEFAIVFFEYPDDISDHQLRLTAAVSASEAAVPEGPRGTTAPARAPSVSPSPEPAVDSEAPIVVQVPSRARQQLAKQAASKARDKTRGVAVKKAQ
jgi:hypothetical protein